MRKSCVRVVGLFSFMILLVFQSHAGALEDFLASENLKQASVGFIIKNIDNDSVVAQYQAEVCRNPASVTKLITTATALELLTDSFCFSTVVKMSGEIVDSVLQGNLYIQGGGDPSLESSFNPKKDQFYSVVADTLKAMGIKEISGRIIGDASLFQEDGAPLSWMVEDIGSSYSPTPSALSVHDNLLSFAITSDSSGFSISRVKPYTSLFQPEFQMSQRRDQPLSWRFSKSDFSWCPVVRGNLPLGTCQSFKTELSEPAYFLADSLKKLLILKEMIVPEGVTTTRWPDCDLSADTLFKELYRHTSAPLVDICRVTNYKSLNLYAENIFQILSLNRDSVSPCSAWSAALTVERYWKKKGLASERIFQVDGSGMSTKNAISPIFIVDLLTYMHQRSSYSQAFLSTLPTAGKHGTVASFMKGTPLAGKTFLKSGSMERVKNYAGYIFANGKKYAFCIFVSNFTGRANKVAQQISQLLNGVVNEDNELLPIP